MNHLPSLRYYFYQHNVRCWRLLINPRWAPALEEKWWRTFYSHFIPEQSNKRLDCGPNRGTKSHDLHLFCPCPLSPSHWSGIWFPEKTDVCLCGHSWARYTFLSPYSQYSENTWWWENTAGTDQVDDGAHVWLKHKSMALCSVFIYIYIYRHGK